MFYDEVLDMECNRGRLDSGWRILLGFGVVDQLPDGVAQEHGHEKKKTK